MLTNGISSPKPNQTIIGVTFNFSLRSRSKTENYKHLAVGQKPRSDVWRIRHKDPGRSTFRKGYGLGCQKHVEKKHALFPIDLALDDLMHDQNHC